MIIISKTNDVEENDNIKELVKENASCEDKNNQNKQNK